MEAKTRNPARMGRSGASECDRAWRLIGSEDNSSRVLNQVASHIVAYVIDANLRVVEVRHG